MKTHPRSATQPPTATYEVLILCRPTIPPEVAKARAEAYDYDTKKPSHIAVVVKAEDAKREKCVPYNFNVPGSFSDACAHVAEIVRSIKRRPAQFLKSSKSSE